MRAPRTNISFTFGIKSKLELISHTINQIVLNVFAKGKKNTKINSKWGGRFVGRPSQHKNRNFKIAANQPPLSAKRQFIHSTHKTEIAPNQIKFNGIHHIHTYMYLSYTHYKAQPHQLRWPNHRSVLTLAAIHYQHVYTIFVHSVCGQLISRRPLNAYTRTLHAVTLSQRPD